MYRPTRSRIFSTRSGSGETLKESCRHGLSPNARQISPTVVWEIPCFAANPRVDQCVASFGAVSKVSTTTASTTSSPIVRAAPGLGASTSPSRRSCAKRSRHFDTVVGCTSSSAPTLLFVAPAAHASPDCSWGWLGCAACGHGAWWDEGAESLEGVEEDGGPGPGGVEVEASASAGEPAGGVQEPVADCLGGGSSEWAGEGEPPCPGQEVDGGGGEPAPDVVADDV